MSTDTTQPGAAPPPPHTPTPIIANWVHLPVRDTAINLEQVSRVEFGYDDYATIYFAHAECDDAEEPGFVTTAQMPIMGDDTAAIRWALGLPARVPHGAR